MNLNSNSGSNSYLVYCSNKEIWEKGAGGREEM